MATYKEDELDLCEGCGTMKHLNEDGLCGRCADNSELAGLVRDIMQVPYSKHKAEAAIRAYTTQAIIDELESLEHSGFINADGIRMDVVSLGALNGHIAVLKQSLKEES